MQGRSLVKVTKARGTSLSEGANKDFVTSLRERVRLLVTYVCPAAGDNSEPKVESKFLAGCEFLQHFVFFFDITPIYVSSTTYHEMHLLFIEQH